MIVRHPFLGLIAGFLLGVGLALVLVQLAIVPFGSWTVIVLVVGFTLLGLIFALAIPLRGAPPETAPPSGGAYQSPPAAGTYQQPAAPPPAAPPPAAPPPAAPPPAAPPDESSGHES